MAKLTKSIKKHIMIYKKNNKNKNIQEDNMNLFTSEQVSHGHPDKICDRISDAILTECLKADKHSRCGIETAIKNNKIFILGEVTTNYDIIDNIPFIVQNVLEKTDLNPEDYKIKTVITKQSRDIALGTNDEVGGAGDQGMMFGYATNETGEMLPIAYVLATKALEILKEKRENKEKGFELLKADAKAQVTFDYDNNRIDTFLISTQHDKTAKLEDIQETVTEMMRQLAFDYGFNTDFRALVNPTGRFVIGSSFADAGLTGRKIIADTYGGVCRHGGGAFSGKDPTKVDRSGAYAARRIAKDIIKMGYADKCEVQLAYAIGIAEPVSIRIETFNTEHTEKEQIENYVKQHYDLTPQGIINSLNLLEVDYNKTSSYGHFTDQTMPWEA